MSQQKQTVYPSAPNENQTVLPRQVAFAAAFLLPLGKFLETPSLLARYAKGDILLPALFWFLIETLVLLTVLYAATRSEKTLSERLQASLGKGAAVVYALFAIYYLFAVLLPILELEKFVYAAFFDTAPTTFYFAAFFLFAAFFAAKGIKAVGRVADFSLFLFLLPFLALIVMSFSETDFSHLLPLFGTDFQQILRGVRVTSPHFSDVALLLPLIANCRFRQPSSVKTPTDHRHDTAKGGKGIVLGYAVGAAFTLLFFAVFYALFSTLAPREHYAFSKIAQYFPALEVIGRIDLLLVYLLTILLFFYTCLPLHYATGCTAKLLGVQRRTWISALLTFALFLFALFCNRFYNVFYAVISDRLAPVFWFIADMLPLFLLFLPVNGQRNSAPRSQASPHKKSRKKENTYA